MKRKQFTFYESFYQAIEKVKSAQARAQLYGALCGYALYKQVPDLETMRSEAVSIFMLVKPVLDTANKRACAGSAKKQIKNKKKTNENQNRNERENEFEIEKELEIEIERECDNAGEGFEIFWEKFPKKVDKKGARSAFGQVDVPLEVLLRALEKQKESGQWQQDGGRFIPQAATWLKNRRWEDELPAGGAPAGRSVPMGATGVLGEAELAAIRRMLAEDD